MMLALKRTIRLGWIYSRSTAAPCHLRRGNGLKTADLENTVMLTSLTSSRALIAQKTN